MVVPVTMDYKLCASAEIAVIDDAIIIILLIHEQHRRFAKASGKLVCLGLGLNVRLGLVGRGCLANAIISLIPPPLLLPQRLHSRKQMNIRKVEDPQLLTLVTAPVAAGLTALDGCWHGSVAHLVQHMSTDKQLFQSLQNYADQGLTTTSRNNADHRPTSPRSRLQDPSSGSSDFGSKVVAVSRLCSGLRPKQQYRRSSM